MKRIYSIDITPKDVAKLLEEKIFPPETVARFIKNNLLENPLSLTQSEPRFWAKILFENLPEVFSIMNNESYFVSHEDALNTIIKSGGVAILAHPFLEFPKYTIEKRKKYQDFIGKLIKQNLTGLEVYYYIGQGFSQNEQETFNKLTSEICKKNNLIVTFGSDCHGPKRNDSSKIFMGKFGSNTIIKLR